MELLETEPEEEANILCGICGDDHNSSDCSVVKFQLQINDTPVPSKARLSLPNNLKIEKMSEGSFSIVAKDAIEEGTRFGPFEAKKVFSLEPDIQFPLKVFPNADYFKEYYLDNSDEFACNWMYFVQPATTFEEQNLICYEDKCNIFYISLRKIPIGEHLKVWYGQYYAGKMDKDVLKPVEVLENISDINSIDVNELVKDQQNIRNRKIWICKFCGKQDNEVTNFATHIMDHYRMQLRKTCEICKANFQTRRSLKKHMTIVHNSDKLLNNSKIDLDKKTEQNKDATNVSEKSDVLGGPLLNEIVSDTFENTSVLLEHMMLPNFDIDQANVMLENENLHLGVDSLLNDNENFDFNIEETNDKFVCEICLKNFSNLRFLVQHLVCHTGKYTCKQCLKVFSRKENFSSHACLKMSTFKCEHCNLTFSLKKYLTRHIIVKHKLQFVCTMECKKVFASKSSLDEHKCVPEKTIVSCDVCGKQFSNTKNLNRHKKLHNAKISTTTMCEICSKQLSCKKHLVQHMQIHKERPFVCKLCHKKFARESAYSDHMKIHNHSEAHICPVCGQKFDLKRYLNTHMIIHDNKYKFNCSECPQKFRQRSNMLTHYNRIHRKICQVCNEQFDSAQKLKQHSTIHYEKCYECPVCKHILKLRSSLLRHLKSKHSQANIDHSTINTIQRQIPSENTENVDNNNINVDSNCDDIVNLLNLKEKDDTDTMQDIDSNLDYIVNNYDPNNFNVNDSSKSNNKSLEDAVIDFNSLEMDFEQNFNMQQDVNVSSQEVCLSMPELTDIDQNITLGENAYILENGTIIEPIEQGKVVLYILDKDQKT